MRRKWRGLLAGFFFSAEALGGADGGLISHALLQSGTPPLQMCSCNCIYLQVESAEEALAKFLLLCVSSCLAPQWGLYGARIEVDAQMFPPLKETAIALFRSAKKKMAKVRKEKKGKKKEKMQ